MFKKFFRRLFGEEVGEELADIVTDTGKAVGKAYLDAEVEKQMAELLKRCETIGNPEVRASIIVGVQTLKAALVAAYSARTTPSTGTTYEAK